MTDLMGVVGRRANMAVDPCHVAAADSRRRIGVMAMVGGKDKTRIRNATPPEFRDVLLSMVSVKRESEDGF